MQSITSSFVHNTFYSNPLRLNDLCDGHITDNTFSELVHSAASGEQESIEFLYNIALQESGLEKKAENALFDIFSLQTVGKVDVDKKIQQMGLQLYQTFQNKLDKFNTASKLSYIAGSAIENASDKQHFSSSLFGEDDIWWSNRLINSDELISGMQSVLKNPERFSLNYPMALEHLDTQISQKAALWRKTECFAIHHNNHWVLFALYKHDNKAQAVVFNSWNSLNNETREMLEDAAKIAKAESINYVEGNLQEHVPNGCGLFVIKAVEKISEYPDEDPLIVLDDMANIFLTHSKEEQEKFNLVARRQLYNMHMEEEAKKKAQMNRIAG